MGSVNIIKGVTFTNVSPQNGLDKGDLIISGDVKANWDNAESLYMDVCAAFGDRGIGIAESCILAFGVSKEYESMGSYAYQSEAYSMYEKCRTTPKITGVS